MAAWSVWRLGMSASHPSIPSLTVVDANIRPAIKLQNSNILPLIKPDARGN